MEKLHFVNGAVVFALLLISPCCTSRSRAINDDVKVSKEIVMKQFELWKSGKGNFFDLLAEDVTWEVSGRSPVSGIYKSKKDFLDRAVNPITRQLKTRIIPVLISLSSDDRFVWLHFKGKATARNGGAYENTYVWKMRLKDGKIIRATAFLDTYELMCLMNPEDKVMSKTIEESKEYIGTWVTKDGHIRHELLLNNRYDEARGSRKSAYRGSYKVTGNHIDYKDDTGFTADGEFRDGILYHAGMALYKEKDQKSD